MADVEGVLRAHLRTINPQGDACRVCRRSVDQSSRELADAGIQLEEDTPVQITLPPPLGWNVCQLCRRDILDRFEEYQRIMSELYNRFDGGEWMISRFEKGAF